MALVFPPLTAPQCLCVYEKLNLSNNPPHSLLALTHSGKVLVSGSDPEGSVGGAVPQDHALWDGAAVDESFVAIPVEARRVPAPLHHLNRHQCDGKLVPVGHLRRLVNYINSTL